VGSPQKDYREIQGASPIKSGGSKQRSQQGMGAYPRTNKEKKTPWRNGNTEALDCGLSISYLTQRYIPRRRLITKRVIQHTQWRGKTNPHIRDREREDPPSRRRTSDDQEAQTERTKDRLEKPRGLTINKKAGGKT